MANSKRIHIAIIILLFLVSCSQGKKESVTVKNDTALVLGSINISEPLKQISLDFVKTYKIDNSIIEVDIDKREFNQIYINFMCRGVSYFSVKNLKPLFSYELSNNSFFVFTGAEQMMQLQFEEAKFKNRRQERCDSVIKSCYLFQDNIMKKEENCTFPEAFSNLPPPSPLPKK